MRCKSLFRHFVAFAVLTLVLAAPHRVLGEEEAAAEPHAEGTTDYSAVGEALPVDLGAIKRIKVAGEYIDETPLRVGNLDILAPIVDRLPGLGATATQAAENNIPDLKNIPEKDRPTRRQFFQLNFPEESENPPLVFAVGRSVAYISKEPYALRAAPLVIKGKLWLPIYSIAPLLAAAPRLDAAGTLHFNPTIQSVEIFEVKGTLTVTVKASAPIPQGRPLTGTMEDPDKVYFDFPGFSMGFDAGNSTDQRTVAGGLREIDKVRAGLFEGFPDTTRVVLDLKRKMEVSPQALPDRSIFAALVWSATSDPIPSPPETVSSYPDLQGIKIVVDAGHGGHDFGATGLKSAEKNHNLDIARRVADKLQRRGATVSMTRRDDTFISLQGRVDFASRQDADIFFSVHINSYQSSSSGTETYYYTPQSRDLAYAVHKELIKATGLPNRGVRTARFFVIRKTRMPSILTETAFISNPTEEKKLMDPDFRERVASAMAQGIINYVNSNLR